jgi:hypothetical protein
MDSISKKIRLWDEIVYGILGALAAWAYIMLMYAAVVAFGGE